MADALRTALDAIAAMGPAGSAAFVLLYAVCCVAFVPAVVLTFGAGAAFGLVKGFFLVWAGATLGACLAFLAGRYLLRDWVSRKLEGFPAFRAVSRAVAKEGWKVVVLTRLSPVLPFILLNYGYGLTGISLREYAWASCIGMVPGTLLYVWLGAAAGEAVRAGAGGRARTPAEWAFFAVGLLATLGAVTLVGRAARRALADGDPVSWKRSLLSGDEHDDALVAAVHPSDWKSPEPKPSTTSSCSARAPRVSSRRPARPASAPRWRSWSAA